ncbi:hypothetical protein THAOC_10761, partial [Thalassiosira oceanica]
MGAMASSYKDAAREVTADGFVLTGAEGATLDPPAIDEEAMLQLDLI